MPQFLGRITKAEYDNIYDDVCGKDYIVIGDLYLVPSLFGDGEPTIYYTVTIISDTPDISITLNTYSSWLIIRGNFI